MKRFLQAAVDRLATVAAVGFAVLGGSAVWAQGQAPTTAASGSSGAPGGAYVLPYALVLLCVFLGVFLVVRPTRRRDRPKS